AKVVKKIAEDYNCVFVPLQEMLDKAAEKFGAEKVLADGVHPAITGAKLIADEWLKTFNEKIKK
ncbi:MAG: lysophospholipase, partial [Clostridia bacterium]|nr:lysophospholipase [Clostridia bacterium]